MYTCYIQSFKIQASFCRWAGWFESYLVENPRRHIFAWYGSYDGVDFKEEESQTSLIKQDAYRKLWHL